jgi:hypothetical protein
MPGAESHYVHRTAWLRAAVLGANDGIISTASLIMGVVILRECWGLRLRCSVWATVWATNKRLPCFDWRDPEQQCQRSRMSKDGQRWVRPRRPRSNFY